MTLWTEARVLLVVASLGLVNCQQSELPGDANNYQQELLAQRDAITNWDDFYAANNFTGWQDDLSAPFAPQVCQWSGVTCDSFDGSIESLDLRCTKNGTDDGNYCTVQAEGTLAPELAGIPTLRNVFLNGHLFSGPLPEAWGERGKLSKLSTLLLSNNMLNGTLPASWGSEGSLSDLQNLKLSFNQLSGNLPASWGDAGALPSVSQLYLDYNMLSGNLPATWGSEGAFPKLKALYMGTNAISGILPPSWGSPSAFPALTDLNLMSNSLAGTLPPDWGSKEGYQKLFILDLALNQLTGTLPAVWGEPGAFPELSSLSLSNNLLSGSIPATWGNETAFPKLNASGLGNNPKLCGSVPSNLYSAVCAPLPFGTDCVGTDLPACTASFPSATMADVSALLAQKNAIKNWEQVTASLDLVGWVESVPVCEWSGVGCTDNGSIITVDLTCPTEEDVQLGAAPPCGARAQGTLAPELASIKTLQTLNLNNLGLSGALPAAWAKAGTFENLNSLYLDGNNLTGTLPDAWSNKGAFPRLQAMSLANNFFNGTLPTSWGVSPALPVANYIYLVGNKLTGPLPATWGNPGALPFLKYMDLSNNTFNGPLPEAWGQNGSFSQMTEMHIANSKLAGPLPDAWGTPGAFPKLIYLSLEDNSLTGSIPLAWNTTASLPSLQDLIVTGNTDLCGSVPYTMLEPVCKPELSQCVNNEQIPCATPPSPPPSPTDSSSSSTPIGAIVGGVVGGFALAAILAFLAFRPRKGWLRQRATVGSSDNLDSGGSKLPPHTNIVVEGGDDDDHDLDSKGMPLVPPVDPTAFSALPVGSRDERAESNLPFSYVTTAGYAKPMFIPDASSGAPSTGRTPSGVLPSNLSDSLHSLETDPMLTFISSRLSTIRRNAGGLSPTSSSGLTSMSGPLPAEVQQWEVQWENIVLERPIGRGSFGKVYLANWNATPVAVKILINADGVEQTPDLELPDEVMKSLQEEAVVMSRMRHPHLVSFMGLCTLPPCILTEYCSRGSLYDVLRQASWRPECAAELTWQLRLSMAFDAARGLLYLHLRTPPIIHRDVKSPNMLVDRNWNVKVCDFNLSEILRHQPAVVPMGGDATNPTWLAPEVLSGERATAASDVYSFGLVLWELLVWKLPWARQPPYQVRRAVLDGNRPEIPPRDSLPGPDNDKFMQLDAYCQLLRDCWAHNPADRPAFADIVPRISAMMDLASPVASIER